MGWHPVLITVFGREGGGCVGLALPDYRFRLRSVMRRQRWTVTAATSIAEPAGLLDGINPIQTACGTVREQPQVFPDTRAISKIAQRDYSRPIAVPILLIVPGTCSHDVRATVLGFVCRRSAEASLFASGWMQSRGWSCAADLSIVQLVSVLTSLFFTQASVSRNRPLEISHFDDLLGGHASGQMDPESLHFHLQGRKCIPDIPRDPIRPLR